MKILLFLLYPTISDHKGDMSRRDDFCTLELLLKMSPYKILTAHWQGNFFEPAKENLFHQYNQKQAGQLQIQLTMVYGWKSNNHRHSAQSEVEPILQFGALFQRSSQFLQEATSNFEQRTQQLVDVLATIVLFKMKLYMFEKNRW